MWPFDKHGGSPGRPPDRFFDPSGRELKLTLYKYDACPYCARVTLFLRGQDWVLPTRDTLLDDEARKELREIGGKTQVPCLVIDGAPLYESADIIEFLKQEVAEVRRSEES